MCLLWIGCVRSSSGFANSCSDALIRELKVRVVHNDERSDGE